MSTPQHFSGSDYVPAWDHARLTGQLARIWAVASDGQWRTLSELATSCHAPAASVSAQLRNLRKKVYGAYRVERRRRGDRTLGLFEYRVLAPLPSGQMALSL